MPFYFEQLNVYQRAVKLAEAMVKTAVGFPREQGMLADLLAQRVLSIPSAIAAASRHWKLEERKAGYQQAIGAGYSTAALAEVLQRMGAFTPSVFKAFKEELEGITRTLGALINSLGKKDKPQAEEAVKEAANNR